MSSDRRGVVPWLPREYPMDLDYMYQSEKLDQARVALMLPHPHGEAASCAEAFKLCDSAFRNLNEDRIGDEDARAWIDIIKRMTGKAESLTTDDKLELSRVVDELASWFDRQVLDA